MDELKYYNSPITLEQAEQYIQNGLVTAARAYVANGYYLRRIRDDKLFEESGFQNFEDYVRGKYNKDKGWASKCIKVNQQLSEGGDSPILSKEYLEYSTYQLVELAYMTEEQREEADPDMTVNQLKQIRKPEEVIESEKSCDVTTSEPEEEQDTLEEKQSPIERGCITGLSPYGVCSCCGNEGAECCGECEESCNGRCGWLKTASKDSPQEKQNSGFRSNTTSCPHRNEYSCTIPFENRTVPGNGNNCGSSCCWSCKFHGSCKLECNASAGRDGTIPEYDAAWFVNEWGKRVPEELQGVLKECKEQKNNSDRAKAVQKYLAPYGYHGTGCAEYDFIFHGFAGGIDLKIGKVDTHLKYGRFVQELSNLYPDFEETVSKESENVIEKLENVPELEESVPESSESVIDGVYEEVPSEQETPDYSPRYFLEEQKDKLDNYLRIAKGKELLPADIKTIECQKTIVAALACMVAELEKPEPEPENVKQDQPELPILKNNDQRAAFIDAYETWSIWIETKETGERYYRYDLPNGTSMVVKVYHAQLFDYKATGKKYEDRYYEGYGKHEYYYLKDGKFFRDCETNRSYLIERLKELQKKVKGDSDGRTE